jgi:MoxR-like ATPase
MITNHLNFELIKQKTGLTEKELNGKGIFMIHHSFRVIATATTSKEQSQIEWFNEEISGLFHFIKVDEMAPEEESQLINAKSNCSVETKQKILEFAKRYRMLSNTTGHENILSKAIKLSTRQLLRICNHASYPNSDLYSLIHNACLSPFLPHLAKSALDDLLQDIGIKKVKPKNIHIIDSKGSITFGDVAVQKYVIREDDSEAKTLIPYTSTKSNSESKNQNGFFDNVTHKRVMRDLALDFSLGEHLLVIGNQGVGKNKLTDRFLELIQYPREYIQLHRDTTVQSLLVQPMLENGRIIYKDSPLLKAVQRGRVLVVDEADKAPVYITSILKSLVEQGEMDIADGRKIRREGAVMNPGDIVLHKVNYALI